MVMHWKNWGIALLLLTVSGCCLPTPMCFRPAAEIWPACPTYGHPCGYPAGNYCAVGSACDSFCCESGCQSCGSGGHHMHGPVTPVPPPVPAPGYESHFSGELGCGEEIAPQPMAPVPAPSAAGMGGTRHFAPSANAMSHGVRQMSWSSQDQSSDDDLPVLVIPGQQIESIRQR